MAGLISNGTYVLGDPNTRDLYVQTPLTTGMSGTSAYIGVTTSALPGNETVLWSGTAAGSAASVNLSESVTAFDKVFVMGNWNDGSGCQFTALLDTTPLASGYADSIQFGMAGYTTWGKKYWALRLSNTNLSGIAAKETAWSATSAADMNTYQLQKVVGINRKEA